MGVGAISRNSTEKSCSSSGTGPYVALLWPYTFSASAIVSAIKRDFCCGLAWIVIASRATKRGRRCRNGDFMIKVGVDERLLFGGS